MNDADTTALATAAPLKLSSRRRMSPGHAVSHPDLFVPQLIHALDGAAADALTSAAADGVLRVDDSNRRNIAANFLLQVVERLAPDPDDLPEYEDEIVGDDPAHDLASAANRWAESPDAHDDIRDEHAWSSDVRLTLWTIRRALLDPELVRTVQL